MHYDRICAVEKLGGAPDKLGMTDRYRIKAADDHAFSHIVTARSLCHELALTVAVDIQRYIGLGVSRMTQYPESLMLGRLGAAALNGDQRAAVSISPDMSISTARCA